MQRQIYTSVLYKMMGEEEFNKFIERYNNYINSTSRAGRPIGRTKRPQMTQEVKSKIIALYNEGMRATEITETLQAEVTDNSITFLRVQSFLRAYKMSIEMQKE